MVETWPLTSLYVFVFIPTRYGRPRQFSAKFCVMKNYYLLSIKFILIPMAADIQKVNIFIKILKIRHPVRYEILQT
jgi:hypothetical protein